jgi:VanZ family protein
VIRWPGSGALKPFARPQRWLGAWWTMIALVIVGSLLPALLLPNLPPGSDKIEHLLGYAILSASAVQLFAGKRAVALAAIGLVLLGVGIEVAQDALTTTREMDAKDALANTLGVILGMASAMTPMRDAWLRAERRLAR